MEVPRLGVSNPSCSCRPTPEPQPRRIRVASATSTAACGNTTGWGPDQTFILRFPLLLLVFFSLFFSLDNFYFFFKLKDLLLLLFFMAALWHIEVSRPGIESRPQLWPHWILLTHCTGPCGFLTHCTTAETLLSSILNWLTFLCYLCFLLTLSDKPFISIIVIICFRTYIWFIYKYIYI